VIRNNRFTYFRASRPPLRDSTAIKPDSMPDPRRRDPSCHERIMPVLSDEEPDDPMDPRGGDYD
jgi:hypothetical protein